MDGGADGLGGGVRCGWAHREAVEWMGSDCLPVKRIMSYKRCLRSQKGECKASCWIPQLLSVLLESSVM